MPRGFPVSCQFLLVSTDLLLLDNSVLGRNQSVLFSRQECYCVQPMKASSSPQYKHGADRNTMTGQDHDKKSRVNLGKPNMRRKT